MTTGISTFDVNSLANLMIVVAVIGAGAAMAGKAVSPTLPALPASTSGYERVQAQKGTCLYRPPASVRDGIRASMNEEVAAADWYRRRATDAMKAGDTETAQLYEHIAKEEDGHFVEFSTRLGELIKASKGNGNGTAKQQKKT